jgi:hypothetical protein
MEEEYSLKKTADHIKQYAEAKMDLFRLELTDRIANTVSSLSSILLITILSLFMFLFLSIGVAMWINKIYVDSSMGFFIVGGFYLLITILLYAFREKLIKVPVINILLQKLHIDEN